MEWSKEAIEAALCTWWTNDSSPSRIVPGTEKMRAALDAAVKAQGSVMPLETTVWAIQKAHATGRTGALEEAAKVAEGLALASDRLYKQACLDTAKAIRALK